MQTTTIRVDTDTHATLLSLRSSTSSSLMDTVREAAEALRRERFAHQVVVELDALRRDPEAWAQYLAEADSTETADGVD
jgi:hypothetical protein